MIFCRLAEVWMMPIVKAPKSTDVVRCPVCGWRGLVGQCDPKPDDLVHCPKCDKPVEREWPSK